jgi:hypothetical protein
MCVHLVHAFITPKFFASNKKDWWHLDILGFCGTKSPYLQTWYSLGFSIFDGKMPQTINYKGTF